MSTAIIIPCYNESKRLNDSVFIQFLNSHKQYSIYFIDDGSSDNTLEILNSMQNENPEKIKVLKNLKNLGKAESVRKGMLDAFNSRNFKYIGYLDADLSTSLDDFEKLRIFLKNENKKAVFGSRLKRMGADIERTLIRHLIGRVLATLIGWMIKLPFYDTQCGAKIFHYSLVNVIIEKPFITKWFFDVEIIFRLKNFLGIADTYLYIYEYPILAWKDVKGSKLNWKDIYKIPVDLIRLRMKYKND